jgi:hypothetical protein
MKIKIVTLSIGVPDGELKNMGNILVWKLR